MGSERPSLSDVVNVDIGLISDEEKISIGRVSFLVEGNDYRKLHLPLHKLETVAKKSFLFKKFGKSRNSFRGDSRNFRLKNDASLDLVVETSDIGKIEKELIFSNFSSSSDNGKIDVSESVEVQIVNIEKDEEVSDTKNEKVKEIRNDDEQNSILLDTKEVKSEENVYDVGSWWIDTRACMMCTNTSSFRSPVACSNEEEKEFNCSCNGFSNSKNSQQCDAPSLN